MRLPHTSEEGPSRRRVISDIEPGSNVRPVLPVLPEYAVGPARERPPPSRPRLHASGCRPQRAAKPLKSTTISHVSFARPKPLKSLLSELRARRSVMRAAATWGRHRIEKPAAALPSGLFGICEEKTPSRYAAAAALRRRAQTRPPNAIRAGMPAPAIGPGTATAMVASLLNGRPVVGVRR